jgi:TonB-linked SusC/RagA family outer membrane protein
MNSKSIYNLVFALLLTFVSSVALAQVTVKGHVTDETGEDIIGATVIQKGTKNATVTDFEGNFSIKVPADATLSISYVGFATQEIPVAGKTQIDVKMGEDKKLLNEVVVVGYGQQKKESVIGAISQVSSADLLATPAANISQALAGKISGVVTNQTSGAPGADDASIFIRGRATFTGNDQPLVLVDGVERAFSQIAPDDIESISVLKDASATAVYGVRGANGVMLITTKRGKDQKPIVSLTANYQITSPTRTSNYLGTQQSTMLLNEAYANDGLGTAFTDAQIANLPDVDWYNEVLKSTAPAMR